MTTALTLVPPALAATLRRRYRQLMTVPARTRWAVGFAGPPVAMTACLVVAALLPASAYRPTPVAGLLAWVLIVSVVTDLLWRRIFNFVLGPALVWVVALHLAAGAGLSTGLPPVSESAIGLAVCLALMVALYLTFRGGEGDVKLVAVLGAVLGWWHGVEAATAGYILAAVPAGLVAVARIAHRAVAPPAPRPPVLAGAFPMAPFFAAGALFTLT